MSPQEAEGPTRIRVRKQTFKNSFPARANPFARLKHYLISTRNADVKQRLIDMYQNTVPRNDLEVFCVSNDDYWNHRGLPKGYAFPFLQLSGIFAVRKHCISIVAKTQLSIAREYINNNIPVLLGEVELWVQSGAGSVDAERKEKIRKTLSTVEARLKQVRNNFRGFYKNVLNDIRD